MAILMMKERRKMTDNLTEQERKEKIKFHLGELKKLRAVPRSDWHAGFEAVLRIDTHKFVEFVHIDVDTDIGEEPARTDYVVLIEDEKVDLGKAIFKIFDRINIIEYRIPNFLRNSVFVLDRALRFLQGEVRRMPS